MSALLDQINTRGYAVETLIFSKAACEQLITDFKLHPPAEPMDWRKGHTVTDPRFFAVGTSRAIVDRVQEVLGKDIVLFGGVLLKRDPSAIHPWHSDMETAHPEGGTLSVWIGLENISSETALHVIPGSHHFGKPLQQAAHENGVERDAIDDATAAEWARAEQPDSAVIKTEMQAGDALFFDGRIWHGSSNTSNRTRWALLLHYAKACVPIRAGDVSRLGWPFHYSEEPRPPCMLVRGGSDESANRIIATPSFSREERPQLYSQHAPLQIPFGSPTENNWDVSYLFSGATAYLDEFSAHCSRLGAGACPHLPHRHPHEELIIVLDGEITLCARRLGLRRTLVPRDGFVHLPAHLFHTIRGPAEGDAYYLIFKWRKASTAKARPGDPVFGKISAVPGDWHATGLGTGIQAAGIFDRPMRHLRKVSMHRTKLSVGAGYPPHADAYDVALLVLRGKVESRGEKGAAHDVFFYAAGEPHGIVNTGDCDAEYLVIEFHGDTETPFA